MVIAIVWLAYVHHNHACVYCHRIVNTLVFMIIIYIALTGEDVDYNSGPYTITFAAGTTNTSFTILITDDNILEGNETFYLTINPSSLRDDTNVDVGNLFQITVIIVEDDCKWSNESMYYA